MGRVQQHWEFIWDLDGAEMGRMVRDSLAAWPEEACGVLVGDGPAHRLTVRAVRPGRNLAGPGAAMREFLLDPVSLLRAERWAHDQGWRVLCVWHSHPSGGARPSLRDRSGDPGYGWQVIMPIPALGPPWPQVWRPLGDSPDFERTLIK
jgi:proteasome lid subunit RPN8/RPN11